MKILLVEPNFNTFFAFRKELVEALEENGFVLTLVAGDGDPKVQKDFFSSHPKIQFLPLPADLRNTNPFQNLVLLHKYKKIISRIKPDFLLTFTIKPNIYFALCKNKNVYQIANITGLGTSFDKKNLLQKIVVALYKKAFKKTNTIFFQNQNDFNTFNRFGIPINDYRLITGSGVNGARFPYQTYPINKIFTFSFISRVLKEKGIDDYLYVAERFEKENMPAVFLIIGSAGEEYSKKMPGILATHSNVRYIPFTTRVGDFYAASDAVVLPSFYHEGLNNVLLESCASGRPIITSYDNPGCKEILVEGKNGFGCKSNDSESIYQACLRLYKTPLEKRAEMGAFGRKFVLENFNRDKVVKDYLTVLMEKALLLQK